MNYNTFNKINVYNNFLLDLDKKNIKTNETLLNNLLKNFEDISHDVSGIDDDMIILSKIKTNNANNYDYDTYDDINNINKVYNINLEVNNINDLINISNTYGNTNKKYNIDVKMLNKIKKPLIQLNNMVGLKELKEKLVLQIIYYIQKLHKSSSKNSDDYLHTILYGPPGVGKTEIAKIMGQIYSKMGILSKEIFKKVSRSDLIAGYLGQTSIKTKDLIKSCIGGVLFIDEAYSLGNDEKKDSFSKECIDTICDCLSEYKNDLMVIIAGYEKELDECFFSYNQGLKSRFIWSYAIEPYTSAELSEIFIKKVLDYGWSIVEDKSKISKWFECKKEYFKFFGRDIETFFTKVKISHGKRIFCKDKTHKTKLILEDLNNGFELFKNNSYVKEKNKELIISSMYV